jgi:hypothetical protein
MYSIHISVLIRKLLLVVKVAIPTDTRLAGFREVMCVAGIFEPLLLLDRNLCNIAARSKYNIS